MPDCCMPDVALSCYRYVSLIERVNRSFWKCIWLSTCVVPGEGSLGDEQAKIMGEDGRGAGSSGGIVSKCRRARSGLLCYCRQQRQHDVCWAGRWNRCTWYNIQVDYELDPKNLTVSPAIINLPIQPLQDANAHIVQLLLDRILFWIVNSWRAAWLFAGCVL